MLRSLPVSLSCRPISYGCIGPTRSPASTANASGLATLRRFSTKPHLLARIYYPPSTSQRQLFGSGYHGLYQADYHSVPDGHLKRRARRLCRFGTSFAWPLPSAAKASLPPLGTGKEAFAAQNSPSRALRWKPQKVPIIYIMSSRRADESAECSPLVARHRPRVPFGPKVGRASCRERV